MPQARRPDAGDPNSPESQVNVNDFPGMFLDVDPADIPPGGAEVQLNATSRIGGELRSRLGYREVTFEAFQ